jgi:hypothetical protein
MTSDRDPSEPNVTAIRPSRGPSAGLVLLLLIGAVVGAIAIAVVSAPEAAPGATAEARASGVPTPSSGAPSGGASPSGGSPAPSSAPSPAPEVRSTVIVLRGVSNPAGVLGDLMSCARASRVKGQAPPAIRGAAVDAVVASSGRDAGWVFVPPGVQAATMVWLGTDVVELAKAVGEQVVAIGTDGAVWLGGRTGASRWRPIETPAGRTAWAMTGDEVAGSGHCGIWLVPPLIPGQRSMTCLGIEVNACLGLPPLTEGQTSDLLLPGADLIVAVPPCADAHHCPTTPVTFVGVPRGWSGAPGALRAAVRTAATGRLSQIPVTRLPDYALDAIGLPALPLPTSRAAAPAADCAETITGPLHAAPWDSRVAWVGTQAVLWPYGTTVQFLPIAALVAPGAPAIPFGATAMVGDTVLLTGHIDRRIGRFAACGVELVAGADTPAVTPGPLDGRGTGS